MSKTNNEPPTKRSKQNSTIQLDEDELMELIGSQVNFGEYLMKEREQQNPIEYRRQLIKLLEEAELEQEQIEERYHKY